MILGRSGRKKPVSLHERSITALPPVCNGHFFSSLKTGWFPHVGNDLHDILMVRFLTRARLPHRWINRPLALLATCHQDTRLGPQRAYHAASRERCCCSIQANSSRSLAISHRPDCMLSVRIHRDTHVAAAIAYPLDKLQRFVTRHRTIVLTVKDPHWIRHCGEWCPVFVVEVKRRGGNPRQRPNVTV